MNRAEGVEALLRDLIELLQLQTRELERLTTHVEQVTMRMPQPPEFSVVASGLSALHQRVKKLDEGASSPQS